MIFKCQAGPRWARYYVGPIQLLVCYGAVVGSSLLGGQCMKTIYLLSDPVNEAMKLYHFVMIFGGLLLILAQIPSFHSLRHINLISLLLCLAYSTCATAGSIYVGSSSKAPPKDYSLKGDSVNRLFGVFTAIAIIATTFGNGIIPEIQATLAPPVKGKMFKGLSVYLQPTNELLERNFSDAKCAELSARNVIPRLISRTLSVALAVTIAAMLPFFGDINALIGAFGFMPLDFTLPVIFFNLTFRPSKRGSVFWLNPQ
ncbi:hypothetical protein C5167_033830 [Papaver somniferum]|uniref:Amino acid transporter transmembrane domain-containing protein n=1 Tax=Papaver somniferum TaxID=3469 RepID=A0A4Y7KE63_PAPSO|nr:hypothetical protein C5167_033830 [Papaver somniferum]